MIKTWDTLFFVYSSRAIIQNELECWEQSDFRNEPCAWLYSTGQIRSRFISQKWGSSCLFAQCRWSMKWLGGPWRVWQRDPELKEYNICHFKMMGQPVHSSQAAVSSLKWLTFISPQRCEIYWVRWLMSLGAALINSSFLCGLFSWAWQTWFGMLLEASLHNVAFAMVFIRYSNESVIILLNFLKILLQFDWEGIDQIK